MMPTISISNFMAKLLVLGCLFGQIPLSGSNFDHAPTNWIAPWAVSAGMDVSICTGGSTQLQATGANSYTWSPATGLSCTNCPNPLASPSVTTTYIVTGSDGTFDDVQVRVITPPTILDIAVSQPTNCNLPNGAIVVTTLGIAPYEYSIDGGNIWQNNGVFTALPPGNYMVKVRTTNGLCEVNGGSYLLVAPPAPQILNVLDFDPTFCDVPNGSITISANGGIAPLQYSIDAGQTWQVQNTFQLLGSGNYQIRVRNANGTCMINGQTVSLSASPDEPIIADVFFANPTNCSQADGLITVIVPNNGGQFEFSIDGGQSYQASNSFPNLSEAVYEVVVRRQDGTCSVNGGIFPLRSSNRPIILGVSSVNPQGCGVQSGNITILAFGPSTLQFSINNGGTWFNSNIFPNLPAANYQIAVRNADGSCVTLGSAVTLVDPAPPVISGVTPTNPTACGLNNGTIAIAASGFGQLQYSIDGGNSWQNSATFNALAPGSYTVSVRYAGGGCPVAYGSNPVVLTSPGVVPSINSVSITQPSICGEANGSILILASGSGTLAYSINGGASFQQNNVFNNLVAGAFPIVVAITGGNCTATASANLVYPNCTDTLEVSIPSNGNTNYCIDPAVFNNLGTVTSAGFCGQGSVLTVAATNINQNCVALVPAPGFTGVSPDLICTVHCFNNSTVLCDTTYLRVTVSGTVPCNPIFATDTVTLPYTTNPTNYCVPVPLAELMGFNFYLNGNQFSNPFNCDFEPTTAYSYTLLPGAGFSGPYFLNSWVVNGNSYSGFFTDANGLLALIRAFDPNSDWNINSTLGLIFGGNSILNYGNMEIIHTPTNAQTILNTNTANLPTGFTVGLTSPGLSVLVVENPATNCSDTLYFNAVFDATTTDTIYLTTTANTPTPANCLDATELPGGNIVNVGYCNNPANGVAPLSSPNCVFYIPNLNYAGPDEFCMVACDGGFPQVCDTTYFIVNVLPQHDTVYLTIPAGDTAIDTCFSNFVIELPGPVTTANFCALNTNEILGSVSGNCLVFNTNGFFYGTTTACVNFCSGGVCDETTVIVTIVPPIICDEVFDQVSLTFNTPTAANTYCIPIPTGEIVNFDVTVDGQPYTQSFTPCGFANVAVYSYSGLPAGPYAIDSWNANGTTFSGVVANVSALVDQLNIWDANGDWVLNTATQTIQGGVGGTYGNISITPIGGAPQSLVLSLVQFPLGSQVNIQGFGSHLVEVTANNGCEDAITLNFVQHTVTTDVMVFNTTPNTSVGQICANTNDLLGNLASTTLCGLPANGAFVPTSATCFIYAPNLGFVGADTACVVVCDDNQPPICDTFLFVINVHPITDTLFITAPSTSPFDTCLMSDVLNLSGVIVSSAVCGANANEVTLSLSSNCVTIDLANSFIGTTIACVVHCDDSTPAVCDTTILVINLPVGPPACPELFNPDFGLIPLQNGVGEVCLPIAPIDFSNYEILLDGQTYSGSVVPCDIDQVFIYSSGQVFGQGAAGPYTISWTLNGQNFSSVAQNVQALVNQMNVWDNAGNWVLQPATFSITSTNETGVYGNLIITHIATGILSTLTPDPNSIPAGMAIQINGAGPHTIIAENLADGCLDTLTINALNGVQELDIHTFEDTPTGVICIDTTGLPGNFVQMTICQQPTNGTLNISGNCFSYSPDPGYVGMDIGCLTVCDNLGNCDTTLLNITVGPLCSLFDIFPDTTVLFQVQSCADIAGHCTAIQLDSIGNYTVTDNGFPYTAGFVPCNGQFAQVALDTGFHLIVFTNAGTGCQDTLLAQVSCVDDNGCGISALSSLDLTVDNCGDDVQFCVTLSLTNLVNTAVTDNGAAFSGNIGLCDINSSYIGLEIDTGLHVLILTDTVKSCADTFEVNVTCDLVEDVAIDTTVEQGDSILLCLEDFGFDVSTIDSVAIACIGNGNTSYSIDDQTWCITVYGEQIGLDTLCFEVFATGGSGTFTVKVTVKAPCVELIPGGQLFANANCALDTGLLCLPFNFADLQGKTIELDGVPYPFSQLQSCGLDSLLRLNYDALPSQGLIGPYSVNAWTVNGSAFSGVFNTPAELLDSMNTWDPTGSWQLVVDPATGATSIIGGNFANSYGDFTIVQQVSGLQVVIGLGQITIPTGVAIELSVGTPHVLTINDVASQCTENALLELICVTSDVVDETILIGTVDTLCLDLSELVGNVVSVTNACPGSGQIVGFTIDGTCVIYEGIDLGQDTACIVVCDDAGICDTTYFYITVDVIVDSLPIAVDDYFTTEQDDVLTIPVLTNDTVQFLLGVTIVTPPSNGSAQPFPDGTINYVPDAGYCNEAVPDSFTYSICNPVGCDTATVFVTVLCEGLSIVQGFSPNGDGSNETFKITGLNDYPDHHLYVYNRWGNLVYEATNYLSDWGGTYKDKLLPDGTYFYVLDKGNGEKPVSGYVLILR
ncbi:MAG: gliding motility-associated C-terminal domain-containing protein [Saprospiraceae bacterium]|nr:gliding motility-associated C-terminal domain-containing protein [Saprospiraceae bacterium]